MIYFKLIFLLSLSFQVNALELEVVDDFGKLLQSAPDGPEIELCSTSYDNSNVITYGSHAHIYQKFVKRNLDGPIFAMLCLNVGLSTTPGHVGHSTITSFFVNSKSSDQDDIVSSKKESYGFWPDINLQKNYGDDHFLKFKNGYYSPSDYLCSPVTKKEHEKMMKYVESRKKDTWTLKDNCNDLSTIAFELATEIEFSPKRLRHLNCAHPRTLLNEVRDYLSSQSETGNFRYTTKIKKEVTALKAFDVNPRSGEPEYTKEDKMKEKREAQRGRRGFGTGSGGRMKR